MYGFSWRMSYSQNLLLWNHNWKYCYRLLQVVVQSPMKLQLQRSVFQEVCSNLLFKRILILSRFWRSLTFSISMSLWFHWMHVWCIWIMIRWLGVVLERRVIEREIVIKNVLQFQCSFKLFIAVSVVLFASFMFVNDEVRSISAIAIFVAYSFCNFFCILHIMYNTSIMFLKEYAFFGNRKEWLPTTLRSLLKRLLKDLQLFIREFYNRSNSNKKSPAIVSHFHKMNTRWISTPIL